MDIPKGDLDGTELISTPDETLLYGSQLYPRGTTEQYPNMIDSAGSVLTNTAHEYVECAGKGICDRDAGECSCFPGYEGSACQRASCPGGKEGVCSGHGTCKSIKDAQKNMISFSFVLVFVTALFMFLGALLFTYKDLNGILIPE